MTVPLNKRPNYKIEVDTNIVQIGTVELLSVKPSKFLNLLSNEEAVVDNNVSVAERGHLDLIPSKYEGN